MNSAYKKYERFIEERLQILNKQGEVVPFLLNKPQKRFIELATGRDILLKARQEGFSSEIGGIFTGDFIFDPNSHSVVIADISENAIGLLDKVKFYLRSYEQKTGIKIPLKYNSKYELENELIESKYTVGTAENVEFGRSKTIKNLHMSEAAFYKHFNDLLASVGQAVRPDGRTVIETTANGFNEFKTFWDDSEKGLTGYNPIFFRASDFYDYEFLEQKKKELKRKFTQEYPESPEEAFITSGNPFFDFDAMKRYLEGVENATA